MYGISNIKIVGYTSEEIKKIYEAAWNKQCDEFIKEKRKELALNLGITPEYLESESSNYPRLKAKSEIYNKCVYKISGGTIKGDLRKPEFDLRVERI